ncbi:MAG TPA: undecaprenyl-diphosphatase UppP [Candidatus Limnocylindrales bacterium]|nr:undecaprenyl-diphosphatase UppP [Candidatus Limnocylindrales bacterium]
MDIVIQALVMGIVQGLTEFLPVSSSGHLILVPFLLGWDDAFLTSLAFSVMLHIGTLVALLVYFRNDWIRLIPAGLAALRDRSFQDDDDRRLAWLLVVATIPAALAGFLFESVIETSFRQVGLVALMLVLGGVLLIVADRFGASSRGISDVTPRIALIVGVAQALALVPGLSRSGVTIAAARMVGLDRESAARFAFLMATPITAGAGLFEVVRLVREGGIAAGSVGPLVVGMVAAMLSGLAAIHFMLGFLRRQSLDAFVIYRFVLAAIVLIAWLAR